MAIKGLEEVRRNMRRTLHNVVPAKAEKAVTIAASIIGGYATLMTPVHFGTLRNSQYRQITTENGKVVAAIGYTVKYAAAVHAMKGKLQGKPRPDGRGNYWGPSGEPKFLTKAGDNHTQEIDQAVRRAMSV